MSLFRRRRGSEVGSLPVEGRLPGFDAATGWLNTPPLTAERLLGKVVLVDFWTYTCINWLRTLGYIRAWEAKYREQGLVVVGVHTPEFPFEHDEDNVRRAVRDMRVEYPVALDSDYGVWQAFSNHYWPAVYIADAQGRIRHHQFGEGAYEECERIIQRLLREAGGSDVPEDFVSVQGEGFEVQADWVQLRTPETYLGYDLTQNFSSAGGATLGKQRTYEAPQQLSLNHWALSGEWTVERGFSLLNEPGGSIIYRFHARDMHLVLRPSVPDSSVRFRVSVDGLAPGNAQGLDVDEDGNGSGVEPRLYGLIRQAGTVAERTFEIDFLDPGVEVYAFTFG